MHPSYQSVLAEFSHLLSTYIVFLGRASFNWAADCPELVLYLIGLAHDDNWGTKIQQVSIGLWPASVNYILSYKHPQAVFLLNQTHSLVLFFS